MHGTYSLYDRNRLELVRCIKITNRDTFFTGVIIVDNGIIQKELLNQKSAGNVTIRFCLKIQLNSHKFVQLMMPFQLSRN